MTNKCEICGRDCKTAQGLAAHKRFQHQSTDDKPEKEVALYYTKEEIDHDFEKVIMVLQGLVHLSRGCRDLVELMTEITKVFGNNILQLKSNDHTLNWRMTELERKVERYSR